MTLFYEISIIFAVAICTFLTRLFPFALFGRNQQPPAIIQYLGKILPSAVIAILIVYCLKGVNLFQITSFAPNFVSIAVVVLLHLWKRNTLLSIGAGTICYMMMVQLLSK